MPNAALLQSLVGSQKPSDLYKSLLIRNGLSTEPVQHWTQGASRIVQALIGAQAMRDDERESEAALAARMNAPGLGGGVPAPESQPGLIPRLAQTLMGGQPQPDQPMPQPNLGPVTSGPRPPNAPPAFAQPRREMIGGMPIYSQDEVNPMDVAGAGHGNAIASIESGGRYNLQGPVTRTGDRAYGKFQVMGANVPSFTREATGTAATPQQFLANPDLQENTFNAKFADYINRYGSPEAAARAWFAGEGGMNNPNARDQLGTTVSQYGQRFAQAAGISQSGQAPVMAQGGAPQEGIPGTLPQSPNQARAQVEIPPQVQAYIRSLYASKNPANIAQADALYQQYAKPREEVRPLTDPRERVRFGIQASDTNPYQVDATGKVTAINPQPFAVNVNQQGASEFEKHYGEGLGKRALGVLEAGDRASVQMQKVQLAQRMLQDIQSGKLTPAQSTVGGWMQAIGLDPKAVGIAPNTPMTAEALKGLTNDLVIGKIGSGGFPANNFSDADRSFLQDTVFNLADRPEANFIKLEVARRLAQFDMEKANAWADARSRKQSYEDFERDWRRQTSGRDIFGDLIAEAKKFAANTPGAVPAAGAQPSIQDAVNELRRRGLAQ